MRISIILSAVVFGLLFSPAVWAGDGHQASEAEEVTPPVEASPPETPIANPASPADGADDAAEAADEDGDAPEE